MRGSPWVLDTVPAQQTTATTSRWWEARQSHHGPPQPRWSLEVRHTCPPCATAALPQLLFAVPPVCARARLNSSCIFMRHSSQSQSTTICVSPPYAGKKVWAKQTHRAAVSVGRRHAASLFSFLLSSSGFVRWRLYSPVHVCSFTWVTPRTFHTRPMAHLCG